MKKQTPASYPVQFAELNRAFADCESAEARIVALNSAVDALPGKVAAAKAAVDDTTGKLAAREVDALLPGSGVTDSEIAALAQEVDNARASLARLERQSEAYDETGETLNAGMRIAQVALNLELDILVDEVRDVLANRIVEKAQEFGELYAAYGAFARATGAGSDWLQLAHVSDPRHAIQIIGPGRTSDAAPNLLSQPQHNDSAEVKAIRPVLEPMAKARALLKKREYTPQAQRIKPGNSLRGSSHGPNGVPNAPVSQGTGGVR